MGKGRPLASLLITEDRRPRWSPRDRGAPRT